MKCLGALYIMIPGNRRAVAWAAYQECAGQMGALMTARVEGIRERTAYIFMACVHSLTASRVSYASERKLFFFRRKEGVGLGKGARACGKSCHFECLEKKQVAKK